MAEPTRLLARLREPWPEDARVRALSIEAMDGAWYMFLRAANGDVLNDTWHASLSDAIAQGVDVYGVAHDGWREVPDGIEVTAFMKN
jgi:hypothetical protein